MIGEVENITMEKNKVFIDGEVTTLSSQAIAELRSDHAGELGAVNIYRGILSLSRDPSLLAFAESHLSTEQKHLNELNKILPKKSRSILSPCWVLAGRSLGYVCALAAPSFAYATIETVETFVVAHYSDQLHLFPPKLKKVIKEFMEEEIHHREDAAIKKDAGMSYKKWAHTVTKGSSLAVAIARKL